MSEQRTTPAEQAPAGTADQAPAGTADQAQTGTATANAGPGGTERTADITATQGGVMTDEVGVVTGELTLKFSMDDKLAVTLSVQYKDAAEWYKVTNGRCQLADARDLDAVVTLTTGLLNRPQG